jgi:hypothetical protein
MHQGFELFAGQGETVVHGLASAAVWLMTTTSTSILRSSLYLWQTQWNSFSHCSTRVR